MGCSVSFTLSEINDFKSGVSSAHGDMEKSRSDIGSAASSTVYRLRKIVSEYEKQLHEMSNDLSACTSALYEARRAAKDAEDELKEINNKFASMSQEEQRANASIKQSAINKSKAMDRIVDSLEKIKSSISTRMSDTSELVRNYTSNADTLERDAERFNQAAFSHLRVLSDAERCAGDALAYASAAVDELTRDTGTMNTHHTRISVSDIGIFARFANSTGESLEVILGAVEDFESRSALAEAALSDAIMDESGEAVSTIRESCRDMIKEIEDFSNRIGRAYNALSAYASC